MKIQKATYEIHGITRLLGSQPANPEIRSQFIASKIAERAEIEGDTVDKNARGAEENSMLPADMDKRNLTVFLRDKQYNICICDYVIKGFLKEALGALKSQIGIANCATKIDNYVLVEPAYLHIKKNGEALDNPDGALERPPRAMTMQGPRVCVTASEKVDAGWELEFDLTLLENPATPKSRALTFDVIDAAMEYGSFKGLGQWRNAQNGRFTFEADDEK